MKKVIKRKLRKVGNSYTITIPPEIVAMEDLQEGDYVTFTKQNGEIILKKAPEDILTPEFFTLVQDLCEENEEIIKGLIER